MGRWGRVVGRGGSGGGSVPGGARCGGGGGVRALVVLLVVSESMVVVVLWPRPQDPLTFRGDVGVGHRLQPLGQHGLVDSGGRLGTWLGEDHSGGVSRPWVGLVVCWGRMVGHSEMRTLLRVWTGSCCVAASVVAFCAGGRGATGCAGRAVLVVVTLSALSRLLWLLGVRVVVPVVWVVLVVLCWAVLLLALGFRLLFWLGLWLGNRLEVEEEVLLEISEERCGVRGLPGLLPGHWGPPRGGRGDSGRRVCSCGFGFGCGLVDEGDGEGRGGGGGL